MTRGELLARLRSIKASVELYTTDDRPTMYLRDLMHDVEADGVLDVQAPQDIAEQMNLSQPAGTRRVRP